MFRTLLTLNPLGLDDFFQRAIFASESESALVDKGVFVLNAAHDLKDYKFKVFQTGV
jgi:hypothetical protein